MMGSLEVSQTKDKLGCQTSLEVSQTWDKLGCQTEVGKLVRQGISWDVKQKLGS